MAFENSLKLDEDFGKGTASEITRYIISTNKESGLFKGL